MTRVRRRLFDLAAAVSLALCVATGVLWVRSYRAADEWASIKGVRVVTAGYYLAWQTMVVSAEGGVYYVRDRGMGVVQDPGFRLSPDVAAYALDLNRPSAAPGPADRSFGFAGFAYFSRHGYPVFANIHVGQPVVLSRGWVIPHWFPAAVTAVLPATRLRSHRRRRRSAEEGLCSACGYDLRATPDRCPECGTPVRAPTAARTTT